ncbi:MAG: hypothetical protein ABIE94_06190 [archaeon]
MKTIILLILILAGMLFMTACTQEEAAGDGPVVNDHAGLEASEPIVKDLEVWYEDEQFFPETFFVNKGDHVRLFVRSTDNIFFSMPDYRINEWIHQGYLDFKADKTGSFEFYCQNCEEPAKGMIHVA